MAELDNLLGSRISLISQVDVRYDGILFSINAKESSIVLKDVRCLGTEERVSDPSKKVPPSTAVLSFTAFPGSDIKDLYLHDYDSATPQPAVPEEPRQQQQQRPRNEKPRAAPAPAEAPAAKKPPAAAQPQHAAAPTRPPVAAKGGDKGSSGIGTGEHLLHLRVKKSGEQSQGGAATSTGIFDFAAALSAFNKTEVMDSVAKEKEAETSKALYKKDDFFDSLSCDVLDREMGRRTHMTNSEERNLNQDTFGAVALQNNYSRGRRFNGSGGGRGSFGRGHSQQEGGRGRGRGGYQSRGGRGGSRGRGYGNGGRGGGGPTPAASA